MTLRARLRSVAAVAAATLALSLAPSAATAATYPVDVTGFTVKDIVFGSSGCKYTTAYVKRTVSGTTDYDISTDVTRYGALSDSLWFTPSNYSDRIMICDYEGLGAYRVGPSEIYDWDSLNYWTDGTAKTFYVRGQAKLSTAISRSGSYVTLTANARYYSPAAYGYRAYSPQDVRVQKWTSTGWKTIRTVDFRSGRGYTKFYAPKWGKYRMVASQTTTTTVATSAAVAK